MQTNMTFKVLDQEIYIYYFCEVILFIYWVLETSSLKHTSCIHYFNDALAQKNNKDNWDVLMMKL